MDEFNAWVGAIVGAITGATVAAGGITAVWLRVRKSLQNSKKEINEQVFGEYQELLDRSEAHHASTRTELAESRNTYLEESEKQRAAFLEEIARQRKVTNAEARQERAFFAEQLKAVGVTFEKAMNEEREYCRLEAAENRKVLATHMEQNAREHAGLMKAIESLQTGGS